MNGMREILKKREIVFYKYYIGFFLLSFSLSKKTKEIKNEKPKE